MSLTSWTLAAPVICPSCGALLARAGETLFEGHYTIFQCVCGTKTTVNRAQSKSQYKRLSAQGANVMPPEPDTDSEGFDRGVRGFLDRKCPPPTVTVQKEPE